MSAINRDTWWSERYAQIFRDCGLESVFESGEDYLRKRRNIDFLISPSTITARVFDEERKAIRVRIDVEGLDESSWDSLFALMSSQALYLARMLAGDLPLALDESCKELGLDLFPLPEQISIDVDGAPVESQFAAAVAAAAVEAVERDPFTVFLLRGLSKEQFLYRSREHRVSKNSAAAENVTEQLIPSLRESSLGWSGDLTNSYWKLGASVDELTYRIRADELPAALLRRLDALPLGARTSDIERALEEAYAHIATRAQAFGLGL